MGLNDYLVPVKYRPVYMCVTKDEYELPIAVADSMAELARIMHVDSAWICRAIKNTEINTKYRKVWIDDNDG